MSIKFSIRVPQSNLRNFALHEENGLPVVEFGPDPRNSPEALWFCFRLIESDPALPAADRKLKLVLKYFETLHGAGDPTQFYPVYRPAEQWWFRTGAGRPERLPDGQVQVAWTIPHPNPYIDIAFNFPYGLQDVQTLLDKNKGYWKCDTVGWSRTHVDLLRLSNEYGEGGGTRPGLYVVARENPGETPASWVLDGMLQQLKLMKHAPFMTWAAPLAHPDGAWRGDYEPDAYPQSVLRGWDLAAPGQHENRVIQQDLLRWKSRCKPALVLQLRAAPLGENALYAMLPDGERRPEQRREAEKWANVIGNKLGREYAAPDFIRPAGAPAGNLVDLAASLGLCSLALYVPYMQAGGTVLMQKQYREAGARLADGLAEKRK